MERNFHECVANGQVVIILLYPLVLAMLHTVRERNVILIGISGKTDSGNSCVRLTFATPELIRQMCFYLTFCALTLYLENPKTTSSERINFFTKLKFFQIFHPLFLMRYFKMLIKIVNGNTATRRSLKLYL